MSDSALSRFASKWRRHAEDADAARDDDLWSIFADLELLEQLDSGQLFCPFTGERLDRESVGGIVATPAGPRPYASAYAGV